MRLLRDFTPGTRVLLRKPLQGVPREFETLVSVIAGMLGHRVEWCSPTRGGRSATYYRDIRMAERADVMLAFFDPEHVMSGGTGHLVEKAQDAGRTVYAYALDEQGASLYIGSQEALA